MANTENWYGWVKSGVAIQERPIAFLQILSLSIKEDLLTNATSTFTVYELPENVTENDILIVTNPQGQKRYYGVIASMKDNTITCNQFIYNFSGQWINDLGIIQGDTLESKAVNSLIKYMNGYLKGSTFQDKVVASRLAPITLTASSQTAGDFESESSTSATNLATQLYSIYENYDFILEFDLALTEDTSLVKNKADYVLIDYIESTGAQYLDTGMLNTNVSQIEFKFTPTANNTAGQLYLSGYNGKFDIYENSSNVTSCCLNILASTYSAYTISNTDINTISIETTKLQINDLDEVKISKTVKDGLSADTPTNIMVGAGYTTSANYYSKAKFYGLKLWDLDGNLVRDLRPVKRVSDSVVGLYDFINDVFYSSATSTAFTYSGEDGEELFTNKQMYTSSMNTATFGTTTHQGQKISNNNHAISDITVDTTIEETNRLVIYNKDGDYRTTYIVKADGDIEQEPSSIINRFNEVNTKVVFSDDDDETLIKANLPTTTYNHKITFTLNTLNGLYSFDDFKLGMPLQLWVGAQYYNTVVTGREYSKDINQKVTTVNYTCGKVRTSLTKKMLKKWGVI